jgi:hypothetical protein
LGLGVAVKGAKVLINYLKRKNAFTYKKNFKKRRKNFLNYCFLATYTAYNTNVNKRLRNYGDESNAYKKGFAVLLCSR